MIGCERLLPYAARHWRGWLVIALATLVATGAVVLEPWPMQIVVDNVIGGKPLAGPLASGAGLLPGADTPQGLLIWAVLGGLVIFSLRSALNVVLTLGTILVGQRMVLDLAHDLFASIQRRSLLFHTRYPVGDSLARVNEDSWCLHTVAQDLFLEPMRALLTGGGMVVVMASVDPGLTVLSVVVVPFMALSSVVAGRPLRALARIRQEIEARLKEHVHQTLSGLAVVQAFAQEERQRWRFEDYASEAVRANRRSALAAALSTLVANGIGTLGLAAILWLGAHHVLEGQLTVGEMLVFVAYLTVLQEELKSLTRSYGALQLARGSIDRAVEALDAERELVDRPGARSLVSAHGWLRLEDVTFGYQPGRPALRDVSLEVRPGQTLALVGPSGAGKSTLASLAPRFFDPWSGRVLVDGHDVRDLELRSLRTQVGLVLQEPFLFPVSVADNIAYGRPSASQAEVEAAARAANAHAFIQRLPQGYETPLGERGATLSGGERQRLSIARALLKNAPILILDEPTSALDAETEGLLLEALERLMVGRTTLLIAHRLSTVRHANWIVVLDDGAIVERGTHAQLLASGGRYAHFYWLQARGAEPEFSTGSEAVAPKVEAERQLQLSGSSAE